MANRDKFILSNLNAGAVDTTDTVIPAGKKVLIKKFGGGDINLGDSKSSAYLLQWGTVGSFTDLAALAFTGNTNEVEVNQSFVGDGTKFLRITRQNNSASNKRCPVWVRAYDNS
jgi:hypothetical protein